MLEGNTPVPRNAHAIQEQARRSGPERQTTFRRDRAPDLTLQVITQPKLTRMERTLKCPWSAYSASAPVTHSRMLPSPFHASWLRPCMGEGAGPGGRGAGVRRGSNIHLCCLLMLLMLPPHRPSPTIVTSTCPATHRPVVVHVVGRQRLERAGPMLGDVPCADCGIGQEPQQHDGAALWGEKNSVLVMNAARAAA